MNWLKRKYISLYYKVFNVFLNKKRIVCYNEQKDFKNLVIYFDYEREFGGNETEIIKDIDIELIINVLKRYSFVTTWFTVGKIIKKYPNSINSILNNGHEIGSHTFSHIAPLLMSKRELINDFQLYKNNIDSKIELKGFHSPNGLWSIALLKLLCRFNYSYDFFSGRKTESAYSYTLKIDAKSSITRFITVGDDWPLFKKNITTQEALDYFIGLTKKIETGTIAGIGFHPWVIFSDSKIYDAFILFLDFLKEGKEFNINTASYFLNNINR